MSRCQPETAPIIYINQSPNANGDFFFTNIMQPVGHGKLV